MKLQALTWRSLPWIKASRPQWRYALRNGIAMCLALSVAYWLNLDEPYWAMTSAALRAISSSRGLVVIRVASAPILSASPTWSICTIRST